MNKFIIITGQTATGKTKFALDYAQKYNGELINCDSRQIYKYLDVITGKDKNLLKKFKIWLYDIIEPDEYFSSFDYVKLAVPLIKKILAEKKTPIIVGGTYLYLKHLLYGIETENIPPDWKLRKKLAGKPVKELQKILAGYSTQLLNQLSQSELNNPQRLIRKIEIARLNEPDRFRTEPVRFNHLIREFIGLKFKEKETLRKTIEKRVLERLKIGAVEEVKKLLKLRYRETDPGLKTIGYRQLISYLKGELNFDTAIQQWITKEIQYAKRQYTFMKKDKNIKWVNVF